MAATGGPDGRQRWLTRLLLFHTTPAAAASAAVQASGVSAATATGEPGTATPMSGTAASTSVAIA